MPMYKFIASLSLTTTELACQHKSNKNHRFVSLLSETFSKEKSQSKF